MKELLIIGAGPAGISLAAEAINNGLKSSDIIVFEKSDAHSFSIRKYYPDEKPVTANYKGQTAQCEGVLCLQDTTKEATLSLLDQVIETNKIDVKYNAAVHKITPTDKGYFIVEVNNESYISKACVVAIGVMGRPNKPSYPIPGVVSNNVHFDITSKDISNRNVLVVGGGDSASEYAQYLASKNNKVALSYRRDSFSRMNSINLELLNSLGDQGKINIQLETDIDSLESLDGKIQVNYKSSGSKVYDDIVYALGGSSPKHFLKTIGIKFDGQEPELTGSFETSVPGLFLIGDLSAGKSGGSIISAFNSSHRAMNTICRDYLDCQFT